MSEEFDVIVVGSGMSGGWAAKEFTVKGYKTLVLDRGGDLTHGEYKTEFTPPWDMPNRGQVNEDEAKRDYETNSECYAFNEYTKHHFLNDRENPYEFPEDKPIQWVRSSKVGGKSVLWHRQSYRFSEMDFEANKKDGHGIDWPIRYKDVEPWYDYVEKFAGISGSVENLPQLPDSIYQKPHEMNIVEKDAKARLEKAYKGSRKLIIGRCAHLTEPTEEQMALGRGLCQSRDQCQRGCSWGGYFSSLSATLPAAERTGNLTLLSNKTAHSVTYDPKTKKATGVKVIDTITKETKTFKARVVFMCASTIATTQILLNSRSETFENGIGNSSGVLGRYLMDHVAGSGAAGRMDGYEDVYYKGRRPTSLYIPRFMNVTEQTDEYIRGFGYQGGASRGGWQGSWGQKGIGEDFKKSIQSPGSWGMSIVGFGEMLPNYDNKIELNDKRLDPLGMPVVSISAAYGENEIKMKEDMKVQAINILEAAGFKNVTGWNGPPKVGNAIHEVGTARMGHDPKTSYLNGYNQSHDVANLFVTDGAAFASTACQNPSLTFMALTARAADHADKLMKSGAI
ncbi:GMC family oxidoreductase [Temperatibacter marinus]|uniref:GMC family oxidoreductase n=1 Tax=Temperatibacter marinus TaxID=1456591 RepID=A0AA52EHN8_9PROT|nr:GMC family oxidoreductase [Temperatibacter marinus]WND02712.1 GMC family oxidoreductase [Temperatibacter marinus]